MRVTLLQSLLVLSCISCAFAGKADGQEILDKKVSLNLPFREIKAVLKTIAASTEIGFTYSSNVLPGRQKITVIAEEERLGDVLEKIFKPLHISFEVIGRQIILKKESGATAQLMTSGSAEYVAKPISGTVTGSDGVPLPGVSVTIEGSSHGTTTDAKGHFQLSANEGDVLLFSSIGYLVSKVKVGASSTIDVTLTKSDNSMGEVVVTALGIKREARS
ncbi:MAG: carboxypeptidase-like regulatory domain-containing protein, partial [Chitinophaga rupis]